MLNWNCMPLCYHEGVCVYVLPVRRFVNNSGGSLSGGA